ncbi:zinc ribbon domain-containing protein [Patescibacteria group bacterium]
MYCTKCGNQLDGSAFCQKCGLPAKQAQPAQNQPKAAAPQPAAQPQPQAQAQPSAYNYQQAGAQQPAAQAPNTFEYFSPGLLILFHYLTFGIFSIIWLGLQHGKMPRIRHDDPSVGAAIGFMFIPFFNWYWIFFNYLRLEMRINEQLYWAKNPDYISHGITLATCIMAIVFGGLAFLVFYPIFIYDVQTKINWLAYARQGANSQQQTR